MKVVREEVLVLQHQRQHFKLVQPNQLSTEAILVTLLTVSAVLPEMLFPSGRGRRYWSRALRRRSVCT